MGHHPAFSPDQIALAAEEWGLSPLPAGAAEKFAAYGELLLRWNAKLNLTAIREPDEIVARHFLECIFCAQQLPQGVKTLLDYGSGAGFPGIPIALCRPEIAVTLAESQRKKAGFLQEAIRTLGIKVETYAGRVDEMSFGRRFDAVAMRAVDRMDVAVEEGAARVRDGGWLVLLGNAERLGAPEDRWEHRFAIPKSENRSLILRQIKDGGS